MFKLARSGTGGNRSNDSSPSAAFTFFLIAPRFWDGLEMAGLGSSSSVVVSLSSSSSSLDEDDDVEEDSSESFLTCQLRLSFIISEDELESLSYTRRLFNDADSMFFITTPVFFSLVWSLSEVVVSHIFGSRFSEIGVRRAIVVWFVGGTYRYQ
jgi:hypothetical protein